MKHFIVRIVRMLIGLVLYSVGIAATIKANIGYAPWDVFHAGLSNTFGLSIGIIAIIVGIVLLVIVTLLGEKAGLGTILNIVLIGLMLDIFLKIIPVADSLIIGILLLVAGLFIISLGSYFYIGSGFGAGPRDNLMVVLKRKTKIPVGLGRSLIELTVTIIGWLLGGMVGPGTIISVIGIGFCIQLTFKILRFDVTSIKHETLFDTFNELRKRPNVPCL